MKLIADTNILVRAAMADDPAQSPMAQRLLVDADLIAIPTVALCELAWVLARIYKRSRSEIATVIRSFIEAENARVEGVTIAAGLALLDAGGDFADGVIAHEGRALGGQTFASFDRSAVKRLAERGIVTLDPSDRR